MLGPVDYPHGEGSWGEMLAVAAVSLLAAIGLWILLVGGSDGIIAARDGSVEQAISGEVLGP